MPDLPHFFRNRGLSEYNDDVLEGSVFNFTNYDYDISIQPSQSTKYWRFGFAFSKSPDFIFKPNEGRYNNQELKYIEIDVGEKNNGIWQSENVIALGSYYVEPFIGNPKLKTGYTPYSQYYD